MKRVWIVGLMVISTLFILSSAWAFPWAVVTDSPHSRIFTVDLGQNPPKLYGPFLEGQLGSDGGGRFDVAIAPSGKFALVSNFGDSKIFRIILTDPTAPVRGRVIKLPFFAEDIAIAPNSAWAAVTDGGFSPKIAFIDLATFTLSGVQDLPAGVYANAVAISPDSRTVVFADYFNSSVGWGDINNARDGLKSVSSLSCIDEQDPEHNTGWPVNIAFSPNGKTVIALSAVNDLVNVFSMTTPGVLEKGDPFVIKPLPGAPGGTQSIGFSLKSNRAYVLKNGVVYPDSPSPTAPLANRY